MSDGTRDGIMEHVCVKEFGKYWQSLMHINQHYADEKAKFKAFSLEQVIHRLQLQRYHRLFPK